MKTNRKKSILFVSTFQSFPLILPGIPSSFLKKKLGVTHHREE